MKTIIFFACFLVSFNLFAAFKGSIEFTPQEVFEHQIDVDTIVPTAAECLKKTYAKHLSFHRRYGISPYYGDQSVFGKLTPLERRAYLRSIGKDERLASQMEPISCVGLAMRCLSQGFAAVNKTPIWLRLEAYLKLNAVDGTALQFAMRKLGWKTLYWNPNTALNEQWDLEERTRNPENRMRSWGWHAYRFLTVQRSNMYYDNPVDDKVTLVNFGKMSPAVFQAVPFYLGTAHTGYHVFPGYEGKVIESHSLRDIRDITTIEASQFNPLNGEGPIGKMYSGLMTIPPGFGI